MTANAEEENVTERFRRAMRHLAATVTILATENEGIRYGMTATAVTSLSLAPPSLLTAVNRNTLFHSQVRMRGAFCVNLLSAHHGAECRAFAGGMPVESRFVEGSWAAGFGRLPYFIDAEVSIFCALERAVDHGTHTIFIGRVEHVLVGDIVDPLIYLNGGFVHDMARGLK